MTDEERREMTRQNDKSLMRAMGVEDMVRVVRCRDCRYWRQEVDSNTHWVCSQHSCNERLMFTTPDFYCADGKRRDNNGADA